MDYGQPETNDYTGAKATGILGRAIETRPLDKCLTEANVINKMIAEATQLADQILERLAGHQGQEGAGGCEEANKPAGTIGLLSQSQGDAQRRLRELVATLEQVGRYV
jgi:hypothetical protein